ncbi:hypothetical protein [Neisseria dumasiana]|uniref:hypothetical protein n=1 Tax=Neisseria dumasiana TaxID=1931275 RepID=UPI0015D7CB57|nr:hypothetical protein [Neisseria dumasiana]
MLSVEWVYAVRPSEINLYCVRGVFSDGLLLNAHFPRAFAFFVPKNHPASTL